MNSPWRLCIVPMTTNALRWFDNHGESFTGTIDLAPRILHLPHETSPSAHPFLAPLSLKAKEIQRSAGQQRSASTGEEICRKWASICSFFLLLVVVKRMCGLTAGTATRSVVGLIAFLWKSTHHYVEHDQNSHPGVRILLLLHSWWIWSPHRPWGKSLRLF